MDKNAVLKTIAHFQEIIQRKGIIIDKVILYGSWAKGVPNEASDIDLVVISSDFKKYGYWERIDILSDAIYEVFEPIEAVGMTPEEWDLNDSYISNYARNGEEIIHPASAIIPAKA